MKFTKLTHLINSINSQSTSLQQQIHFENEIQNISSMISSSIYGSGVEGVIDPNSNNNCSNDGCNGGSNTGCKNTQCYTPIYNTDCTNNGCS